MKIARQIIELIILLLIIGWGVLIVTDFLRVKNDEEPKFCISSQDIMYDDGLMTHECVGLGYKVYKYYENDELTATEFGVFFFVSDRNAE